MAPMPEADMLLCAVLGLGRADLIAEGSRDIGETETEKAVESARRRAAGEPLQYITGKAPFMGRMFNVTPDVLIPRFDTEILCGEALKELSGLINSGCSSPKVLDLCTGSGIIAVTLGLEVPTANITASDISPGALSVAELNAREFCANRIGFVLSDLFEQLKGRKFDIIVSNPPYISKTEMDLLPEEVGGYEPALALYGGIDGLDVYRKIISKAGEYLTENGMLAFEIGMAQAAAVRALLEQAGFANIRVIRDLEDRDRVVRGNIAVNA